MTESYIAIPDASLAIGKPVTSNIAKQLRDNPIAIAQGNTAAEPIWAQALRYQDFTASGTFEVPQGCTKVFVEVIGGGAGGRSYGSGQRNYGAGAGGYARGWVTVTPGALITVTIGAGGTGEVSVGSGPNSGGTSSFGSYMSATGGTYGATMSTFNAAYNQSTVLDDLSDWLTAASNGGRGVGGEMNFEGSAGEVSKSDAAEGGRGFGGRAGSDTNGAYYGDGGASRQSASGYNGKSGLVRVWY